MNTAPSVLELVAPAAVRANPFPGLRPFREDEEYLFFGRENQVDAMVDELASTRFLAVVGTSGSGKSSLVNCGLRPALRGGLMARAGTAWRMAQFRPGTDPLRAMAWALAQDGVLFRDYQASGLTLAEIIDTTLRMSKLGLIDIYEQANLGEDVNLLVVVDQFEELFRYRQLGAGQQENVFGVSEAASAFVNLLLEARAQTTYPIYVVLTMRSDFLGDCTHFPGLAEAINAGQYLVPRMTRDERRAAILGPVGVGGAEIAPVLLTRLVNDVGDNPDQLSILQHALNRTWARWQNEGGSKGPLDLPHYEAIGTMAHALDKHAERAYAELGTPRQQQICEKLFKALTDKATDPRGIRRPTTLGTLCALADATAAEVTEVINVFRKPSRSFLMPPAGEALEPETTIDISHESLMRVWQRLNTWADEEAQSAQTYRRLADTAALHAAGKASLWRDPDLTFAREWQEREAPNATWAERYGSGFDDASAFLRDSEAANAAELEQERQRAEAERIAKEHELEQAKALAEAQRQRADEQVAARIRQRRMSWGLAAILGLALGLAGFGWYKTDQAQREKDRAQEAKNNAQHEKNRAQHEKIKALSMQLAALADDELEEGTAEGVKRALLFSTIGYTADPTKEARQSLQRALAGLAQPQPREPLKGHKQSVVSVAFSPDRKTLASASEDQTVRLWDVASSKPLGAPLKGHQGVVRSVAFSPDGKMLASASEDQTVILWNVETHEQRGAPLKGHQGVVRSVAFSPDGKTLASASEDQTVILWDVESHEKRGEPLTGHHAPVRSVAFSPDGKTLASASEDQTVILWNVETHEQLGKPLTGHLKAVRSVAFSPDGNTLASASEDKTVILWDVASHTPTKPLKGHQGVVQSVAFSPDGKKLASASADQTVILWDVASGEPRGKPLKGHQGVAFSPDGMTLASASADKTVRLWDMASREQLGEPLEGHKKPVRSVAFRPPDGRMLASASDDNTVILWDVAHRTPSGEPLTGHQAPVRSVAFSPDGKTLASASEDKTVILWNVETHEQLGNPLTRHLKTVRSVAFSPDGSTLASASEDKTVILWNVETHEQRGKPLTGHRKAVRSVAFSPDGNTLASASEDKTVILWNVETHVQRGEPLKGHQGVVQSVAFSPDGKTLASASEDQTVILWNVETHEQRGEPLTGHQGVAFSPDNKKTQTLACASADNTVILWDVASRKKLGAPLKGHQDVVRSVAFSPDGKKLASASADNTVILWDIDVEGSWISKACAIANRDLTQKEWTEIAGADVLNSPCHPVHPE